METADSGNLVEWVRQRILEDLRNDVLGCNGRVNASSLAKRYGVSRTPVREALRQLENEGELVCRANAGFQRRIPTLAEICDVYELRELLEGYASEKLAESEQAKDTAKELRKYATLRRKYRVANDEAGFRQADQKFHSIICHSCPSALMRDLLQHYLDLDILFTFNAAFSDTHAKQDSDEEHDAIVAAIEAG